MPARRTSVLVVEDEVEISDMIADVLDESGFAVHTAAAGEEALRYLQSGAEVDVLFTDINLLGPMDGSILAREARAQRPELPIVYCSGRYSPSVLAPPVPRSIFVQEALQPGRFVPAAGAADSGQTLGLSAPHAAAREELFEPVDVIIAVDDVLLAHQRAE